MDSSLKAQDENEYPLYFYIHLFFIFIELIIYIIAALLFYFYFNSSSYIKKEFFTFTILNSFKSFLEITLPSSHIKDIIIYIIGVIEFYLILAYINKSLSSKKISQNNTSYELDHFWYIIIIFILSSFPYVEIFNLSEKYIFSFNTVNIILAILLFRYINIRMQLLLEYLKEKKMTNSAIPDIYLPYLRAHFYYTMFNRINIIFYVSLVLVISFYLIKILDLFIEWKIFSKYILLFLEESLNWSLIISCFIFFYSYHKKKLIKGGVVKDKSGEEANLAKFSVIDVDIQQDENSNLSERKKPNERKKISQNDDNEEEDKAKENIKVNEESEALN